MDKEYYREKIEHFIAGVEDEKDLKRIYDYVEKNGVKVNHHLTDFQA